jgi:hypothetical protein
VGLNTLKSLNLTNVYPNNNNNNNNKNNKNNNKNNKNNNKNNKVKSKPLELRSRVKILFNRSFNKTAIQSFKLNTALQPTTTMTFF